MKTSHAILVGVIITIGIFLPLNYYGIVDLNVNGSEIIFDDGNTDDGSEEIPNFHYEEPASLAKLEGESSMGLDIILSESIQNLTEIELNSTENSFDIKDSAFESTSAFEIEIDQLIPMNVSIDRKWDILIEDQYSITAGSDLYSLFRTNVSSYLQDIQLFGIGSGDMEIGIYSAEFTNGAWYPNEQISTTTISMSMSNDPNVQYQQINLDLDSTQDGNWFLCLNPLSSGFYWDYAESDEILEWRENSGTYSLISNHDFAYQLNFSLSNPDGTYQIDRMYEGTEQYQSGEYTYLYSSFELDTTMTLNHFEYEGLNAGDLRIYPSVIDDGDYIPDDTYLYYSVLSTTETEFDLDIELSYDDTTDGVWFFSIYFSFGIDWYSLNTQDNVLEYVNDGSGFTELEGKDLAYSFTFNYSQSFDLTPETHSEAQTYTIADPDFTYFSFDAPDCDEFILDDIFVYAYPFGDIDFEILPAILDGNYEPDTEADSYQLNSDEDWTTQWEYVSSEANALKLDNSHTTNNVWFIKFSSTSGAFYDYVEDTIDGDNSTTINMALGTTPTIVGIDLDFYINFEAIPIELFTPNQLGLMLNINDESFNFGHENNLSVEFMPIEDNIISINADWNSFNLSVVQYNLTYIQEIESNSVHYLTENNSVINWSIVVNISQFEPEFDSYAIQFEIPFDFEFLALNRSYEASEKTQESIQFEFGSGLTGEIKLEIQSDQIENSVSFSRDVVIYEFDFEIFAEKENSLIQLYDRNLTLLVENNTSYLYFDPQEDLGRLEDVVIRAVFIDGFEIFVGDFQVPVYLQEWI